MSGTRGAHRAPRAARRGSTPGFVYGALVGAIVALLYAALVLSASPVDAAPAPRALVCVHGVETDVHAAGNVAHCDGAHVARRAYRHNGVRVRPVAWLSCGAYGIETYPRNARGHVVAHCDNPRPR